MADELRVVPADEAGWDAVQAVFTGEAARCQCQRQRLGDRDWWYLPVEERAAILRAEIDGGREGTIGLVGILGDEPVGWVAVDRRSVYGRLRGSPVPWKERPAESKDDDSVWAIACVIVRAGFRRRGYMYPLVAAAAEYARARGAAAVEGYPLVPNPGQEVIWHEMSVGAMGPFLAAGFREVSAPTKRRRVVRLDFDGRGP